MNGFCVEPCTGMKLAHGAEHRRQIGLRCVHETTAFRSKWPIFDDSFKRVRGRVRRVHAPYSERDRVTLSTSSPFDRMSRRVCTLMVHTHARLIVRRANSPPRRHHTTTCIRIVREDDLYILVNDPSAGSPTETLLRLLLPLNGRVRSSSRMYKSARNAAVPRSEDLTAVVQSVVATGGVYKGQGRNQRELMTRAYWEFLVHGEQLQAPIPSTKEVQRVTR